MEGTVATRTHAYKHVRTDAYTHMHTHARTHSCIAHVHTRTHSICSAHNTSVYVPLSVPVCVGCLVCWHPFFLMVLAHAARLSHTEAGFLCAMPWCGIVPVNDSGRMFRLLTKITRGQGVVLKAVDTTNVDLVAEAIGPNTKLMHMETPSNPLM